MIQTRDVKDRERTHSPNLSPREVQGRERTRSPTVLFVVHGVLLSFQRIVDCVFVVVLDTQFVSPW